MSDTRAFVALLADADFTDFQKALVTLVREVVRTRSGTEEDAIARRALLEPLFVFRNALSRELDAAERAFHCTEKEKS